LREPIVLLLVGNGMETIFAGDPNHSGMN